MKPEDLEILNLIKDEISSYDRYEANELIAIDRSKEKLMVWGCQKFSYAQWLMKLPSFTAVKVDGLLNIDKAREYFSKLDAVKDRTLQDIILFCSQHDDYSFDEHDDIVDVYLYVLKGKKEVKLDGVMHTVNEGEGIFIPEGVMHQVFNTKDTWAVSLGLK